MLQRYLSEIEQKNVFEICLDNNYRYAIYLDLLQTIKYIFKIFVVIFKIFVYICIVKIHKKSRQMAQYNTLLFSKKEIARRIGISDNSLKKRMKMLKEKQPFDYETTKWREKGVQTFDLGEVNFITKCIFPHWSEHDFRKHFYPAKIS